MAPLARPLLLSPSIGLGGPKEAPAKIITAGLWAKPKRLKSYRFSHKNARKKHLVNNAPQHAGLLFRLKKCVVLAMRMQMFQT